ncbi:MAG TPA: DMT family transporter [Burkholderiales bacterium]|nr:DMT family transporter [Burkholderiales bacterium]
MKPADYGRLLSLAAIWGASFIFIRVTAPAFGPVWMAEGRMLIGGLALAAWFALTGFDTQWRRHLRFYALIGIFNSALPFSLFGFGGLYLAAPVMAILNATSPMFGLLLGALFAGERITAHKLCGLVLGAAGVALIARPAGGEAGPMYLWAVAACLGAALCYGITGVVVQRWGAKVPSRGTAVGSQLCGALILVPLLPFQPPAPAPSALVLANLAALGLLASSVALLLYFRLMAEVGATRALTVTFLIPLFSFLWGVLFLAEGLSPPAIGGALLVLAGTLFVTRSRA